MTRVERPCRKCAGSGHHCAQCQEPVPRCACVDLDEEFIVPCGPCGSTGKIVTYAVQPTA